jgi:hypothetical protein
MVKSDTFTMRPEIGQEMRDGILFYEHWKGMATTRPDHPVSVESAKRYRSTWLSFLLWLPNHIHWTKVSPEHVSSYLKQIESSASVGGRHAGCGINRLLDTKVRRCLRMLRDIYGYAHSIGACQENPCLTVREIHASQVADEAILTGWEQQSLIQFVLQRQESNAALSWRELCNDALLLTLALTGMTCAEVVRLLPSHLAFVRRADRGARVIVSIDGDRTWEPRSIAIDHPVYVRLLRKWSQWHTQIDNAPAELFFGGKPKTVRLRKLHTPLTAKAASILVAEALAASGNPLLQSA